MKVILDKKRIGELVGNLRYTPDEEVVVFEVINALELALERYIIRDREKISLLKDAETLIGETR